MRVAAFGRTEILYNSIDELRKRGHEIVLIITCKASQFRNEIDEDEEDIEDDDTGTLH